MLNDPFETEQNKNDARRLLGLPTVSPDEYAATPTPFIPIPPTSPAPVSPLQPTEYNYKFTEECSWLGCVYEIIWEWE